MQAIPNLLTILACLFPVGDVDRSFSEGFHTLSACVVHVSCPGVEEIESPAHRPSHPDSVFVCQGESEMDEEDPETIRKPLEFSHWILELSSFPRSLPFSRSLGDRVATVSLSVATIMRC